MYKEPLVVIALPDRHWQKIIDSLDGYQDMGPDGMGWKSDELSSALGALESAYKETKVIKA